MATMTGKAARKSGGNRYACKRLNRHTNPMKKERWQAAQKQSKQFSDRTKAKYGL